MHESFQRLLEIAKELNQEEIARKIDELPQTLTNWKRRGISKAGALKISAAFDVSANWILTGKKQKEDSVVISLKALDSNSQLDIDELEVPHYKEVSIPFNISDFAKIKGKEKTKMRISNSTLVKYNVAIENAFAITATGDSMSPVINNNAVVYVDLGTTNIIDGKIYAISHGGLFEFKYLYRLPKGGVRIVSANKQEYPEVILTAEQVIEEEFSVIAYAFSVQNPLP
ncbi:S24 family peptidase [Acinetobacter sp. HY1485]|uniref:S24 family peptidase n=1 Tax=Acinetobacter sp. HY1485 TaxID=2970918 RepID=UPI0022B9B1B1|nr:S24 family peptidase [Acinetobacter sp. HY1485]